MTLIENALKGAAVGVLGLMALSVVGGGVVAGAIGLLDDPVVMAFALGGFLLFLLLLVGPVVVAGLWLYRWWRLSAIREKQQSEFIAPDEAGRLPVPASLLRQQVGAQLAFAQNVASFTNNLTHYHYNPESNQSITEADGQTMTAAATTTPETFWQLYQAGQLPSKGFLMGYSLDEDGQEVTADWPDLYSSLINGRSGMGKSTLIRSILAQSALQGGRFVVVDPHYGAGPESTGASLEPLRGLMLCDVASEEKQIVDALRYVSAIGQQRISGKDKERWPLVLVVDETTKLFQRSNVAGILTDVLALIAQETRKVGVYAMCLGQNFDGRIMDTTIRNSFVSMISMRSRRDVARVMSGSTEFGKMAETLTIGQCVWMTPMGEMHRLAVPNCTAADLDLVARSLNGKNVYVAENHALPVVEPSSKPSSKPSSGIVWEVATEDGLEATTEDGLEDGLARGARAQRVREMTIAGISQTDIITEIWQCPKSGRAYQAAAEEYRSILSDLMKGGK